MTDITRIAAEFFTDDDSLTRALYRHFVAEYGSEQSKQAWNEAVKECDDINKTLDVAYNEYADGVELFNEGKPMRSSFAEHAAAGKMKDLLKKLANYGLIDANADEITDDVAFDNMSNYYIHRHGRGGEGTLPVNNLDGGRNNSHPRDEDRNEERISYQDAGYNGASVDAQSIPGGGTRTRTV